MQTKKTPIPRFSVRSLIAWVIPILFVFALAQPGCATRTQVAEIVAESNAAMLAGQFGLPELVSTDNKPAWQESSDRIEAFIAAHPDQPAATAPLRIRQAMLLLSHQQFNLAAAAFNAAAINNLHSDRDQALKRSQDTLLWWFANSTKASWIPSDHTKAAGVLKQLEEEQIRLSASPEIRDYLAEMRAWIGLSAAKHTTSASRARELVEDALNGYAGIFTPEDLRTISTGEAQLPDPKAIGPDIRRRVRVKTVLEAAQKINRENSLGAHPKTSEFDQFINR